MQPPDKAAPIKPDFGRVLSAAVQSVRQGRMPAELLLDLVRERTEETVEYCISKLVDPDLNSTDEAMITHLVRLAGLSSRLVQKLISLEQTQAETVALRLHNTDKALGLKLSDYLQSEKADVVIRALDLLDAVGGTPQLMPLLFSLMKNKSAKIQSRMAFLIQKMDTEHTYTQRLMQHADPRIRANALQAIADSVGPRGAQFLQSGISDPDNRVRTLAAVGLTRRGDPVGMRVLLKMLRDPNAAERRSAAWGLGTCGNSGNRAVLASVAQTDSDARVRALAIEALEKLGQKK